MLSTTSIDCIIYRFSIVSQQALCFHVFSQLLLMAEETIAFVAPQPASTCPSQSRSLTTLQVTTMSRSNNIKGGFSSPARPVTGAPSRFSPSKPMPGHSHRRKLTKSSKPNSPKVNFDEIDGEMDGIADSIPSTAKITSGNSRVIVSGFSPTTASLSINNNKAASISLEPLRKANVHWRLLLSVLELALIYPWYIETDQREREPADDPNIQYEPKSDGSDATHDDESYCSHRQIEMIRQRMSNQYIGEPTARAVSFLPHLLLHQLDIENSVKEYVQAVVLLKKCVELLQRWMAVDCEVSWELRAFFLKESINIVDCPYCPTAIALFPTLRNIVSSWSTSTSASASAASARPFAFILSLSRKIRQFSQVCNYLDVMTPTPIYCLLIV